MSAHDELERQLLDSVAARARDARPMSAAALARWRRRIAYHLLGRSIPAVLIAAALAVLLSVQIAPRQAPIRSPGQEGALTASIPWPCKPCQAFSGQLHAPLRAQAARGGEGEAPPVRFTSSAELPPQTSTAPLD